VASAPNAGTVFEIGYMIGQSKPAFEYTLNRRHYRQREGAANLENTFSGKTIQMLYSDAGKFYKSLARPLAIKNI